MTKINRRKFLKSTGGMAAIMASVKNVHFHRAGHDGSAHSALE